MKTNKPAPWKGALALLAALALPASAARLAYEGFDYTQADGTTITGLNGGFGWDEAYPAPNAPLTLQPGLAYSGGNAPATIGKSMNFGTSANMSSGRDWADSTAAPADGTYYYSFQIDPIAAARGTFIIMKGTNSGDGQNGFGIRLDNNGGNPQFKAWNPSQNAGANIDFPGGYGSTYFVVGKITIVNGGVSTNSVSVFNSAGTIPLTEPAFASTATADATNTAFLRATLSGRAFSNNTGYRVDEIRIGTSYNEIFPQVGNFTVSPASGVLNQELTFDWSAIPSSATSITLNPGNIDLLTSLTTNGAGTTTLPAPATSTNYTLTYSDGGSITEVIEAPYTAIAPFLTISPSSGYLGDTLTLNWRIPAGATNITLTPNDESIDMDFQTDSATGIGTAEIPAPAGTTLYTITWTGAGDGATGVSSTFTLLDSFVGVTPDKAIAQVSDLTIQWRIDPLFSSDGVSTDVFLDVGPIGGPYTTIDVTTNTDPFTGAGTFGRTPILTDVEYRIRYHLNGVEQTLTDTVTLYPKVFNLGTPVNNTQPVQTNLLPMFDAVTAYSDRSHAWAAVPSILQGAQFAKLGQGDKATSNLQIPFTAITNGTFFLLIDNRIGDGTGGTNPAAGTDNPPSFPDGVMTWVLSSGFVDSGLDVGLDENPVANTTTIDQSYSIFFRQVSQGETFTFLQQADGDSRNMYGIAAVTPQIDPVTFFASPPAINTNQFDSTVLNWTVPVGATVTIDQGVGPVDINEFGVGSTIVSPTVTTTYTLTYDPVGASPPVSLPPVTVYVNSLTATPDSYTVGGSTTLSWQIPPGATNVLINQGVGNVTADTNGAGAGSKANVATTVTGTTSYTLTYVAPGETNATTVGPISVFVLNTPFGDWMATNYPEITAPNNTPGANPDGDSLSNFGEFAFAGHPGDGSNNGAIRSAIDNIAGTNHLTLTFACRVGATFSGPGPVVATGTDGVDYTVGGSTDLSAFTVPLNEVTPAITTGLPDPAPDGYEYRTFRVTAAQSANPKAFMQAVAEESAP